LCLRDVEYRIHARVELADHADKDEAAYREQFRRRVNRGACFQAPFLGAREFPAAFFPPDDQPAISHSEDFGVMLHRIDHGPPVRFDWFHARLDDGVLHIPAVGVAGQAVA
jgi:CRISPR-associated protein Cas5d